MKLSGSALLLFTLAVLETCVFGFQPHNFVSTRVRTVPPKITHGSSFYQASDKNFRSKLTQLTTSTAGDAGENKGFLNKVRQNGEETLLSDVFIRKVFSTADKTGFYVYLLLSLTYRYFFLLTFYLIITSLII